MSEPTYDDVPVSRWGTEDQLGAANLLPTRLDATLLPLIGQGRVFDLTQEISAASPRIAPGMSPFTMCMWSHPQTSEVYLEETFGAKNAMAFADERIEGDLHTGTHIDALGHAWIGDLTFNRRTTRQVVTNGGLRELGIENLPPVVARGVLVDAPVVLGRPLEGGEVVDTALVRRSLDAAGLTLRDGDVLLLRTGWAAYYADGTDRFTGPAPGIDVPTARWLAEQGVAVVGSDTMSVEVWPSPVADEHFPVHQELLVRQGVYLLEQADLDPLSVAGVHEFLCLCLAPKFTGGTAAPVRLVAIA